MRRTKGDNRQRRPTRHRVQARGVAYAETESPYATTLLQFHEASIGCEANFAHWQAMLR